MDTNKEQVKELKKKPAQKGRDYSRMIVWSAALVTVMRYAAAFVASDASKIPEWLSELITASMLFSGLGMGFLDVFGGAYLFDGWRRAMPQGEKWNFRFRVLTFFAIGLVVNGVFILVPFTASRVSGQTMHQVLGDGTMLYLWAAVVNIAPYLLIGGVAVGNQIVNVAANRTANEPANGSRTVPQTDDEKRTGSRTYKSLSDSEKYYIINTDSKIASRELGVTPRAIQKWRLDIQEEIRTGKLLQKV